MDKELIAAISGAFGGLIGVAIVSILIPCIRYWIWLRRFKREYRLEREQWFKEHAECCELDESYLSQPYG